MGHFQGTTAVICPLNRGLPFSLEVEISVCILSGAVFPEQHSRVFHCSSTISYDSGLLHCERNVILAKFWITA
jgi:hypothetical protein